MQQTGTFTATTGTAMTGTATAAAKSTPAPVLLVKVWSNMCVDNVPYVLLGIPINAKFALVPPAGAAASLVANGTPQPGQLACVAMGTLNGQQLVMCTGPSAHTYTLYVHNDKGTQQYAGTLWDCGVTKAAGATAIPSATLLIPIGPTTAPGGTATMPGTTSTPGGSANGTTTPLAPTPTP